MAPAEGWYDPAGQTAQSDAAELPNAAEKVPAAHAIGIVAFPKQYDPAGQTSQVELSLTEEYVPAGQTDSPMPMVGGDGGTGMIGGGGGVEYSLEPPSGGGDGGDGGHPTAASMAATSVGLSV